MRSFKAIILLILFSVQLTVFTVERGFCSDKLVNIEINGEEIKCLCGHEIVTEVTFCSISQKPCCTSDTIEKNTDSLSSSEVLIDTLTLEKCNTVVEFFSHFSFKDREGVVTFSNPPPVKRKTKSFIIFQNFKGALTV